MHMFTVGHKSSFNHYFAQAVGPQRAIKKFWYVKNMLCYVFLLLILIPPYVGKQKKRMMQYHIVNIYFLPETKKFPFLFFKCYSVKMSSFERITL